MFSSTNFLQKCFYSRNRFNSVWFVTLLVVITLSTPTEYSFANAQTTDDDSLTVTLLGTGTPGLRSDRFGAANLVQAGGLNILIDAGRGASVRLAQAGLTPGQVDAVFLTHFHSDHVNGLADIFLVGYITATTLRGRKTPFELYGPVGTQQLADGLRLAHKWDSDTRILDEKVPEAATKINVYENSSGVVFEKKGVTVTSFSVLHGKNVAPSVGYRVDYKGKSVVFSGDTKFDENVIKFGRKVDLLVHEVAMATQPVSQRPSVQRVLAHHTSPEEAGRIFLEAKPKLAVYTHMVLLGDPPVSTVIEKTRTVYDGPLIIGEDLMQFIVSERGLTIVKAGR